MAQEDHVVLHRCPEHGTGWVSDPLCPELDCTRNIECQAFAPAAPRGELEREIGEEYWATLGSLEAALVVGETDPRGGIAILGSFVEAGLPEGRDARLGQQTPADRAALVQARAFQNAVILHQSGGNPDLEHGLALNPHEWRRQFNERRAHPVHPPVLEWDGLHVGQIVVIDPEAHEYGGNAQYGTVERLRPNDTETGVDLRTWDLDEDNATLTWVHSAFAREHLTPLASESAPGVDTEVGLSVCCARMPRRQGNGPWKCPCGRNSTTGALATAQQPMTGLELRGAMQHATGATLEGIDAAFEALGTSWQVLAELAHRLASEYENDAHQYVYVGVAAGYLAAGSDLLAVLAAGDAP